MRKTSCSQEWLVILDWDADGWYLERVSPAQAEAVRTHGLWPGTYGEFGATWPSGGLRWSVSDTARTFGSTFDATFLFPS